MKSKKSIIEICLIVVALFFIFAIRFIPFNISGLPDEGVYVLGVFVGCLILWLGIGIDWPSLLCIFALGTINSLGFKSMFSASFGNETFVFLLFTFICTYAISKTSFIKRIAIWFVTNKLARKSGWVFAIMFLLSALILGCFISPSVLFVLMLPILEEIFKIANIEKGEKVGKMLMLGLAFTISISSGMTPIAHVFPILAINAASLTVNLGAYTLFAFPIGLLAFCLMILMFWVILRPDMSKLKNLDTSSLKNDVEKITAKDIVILCIFCLTILLWIIPSFFKNVSPEFYNFINNYGTAMPPLLGTLLLCIIKVKNEKLIDIKDAFKNGVPWASLLMCAGTLALGSAMTNDKIGLKLFLQNNLGGALGNLAPIVLLIIFVIWALIQTNLSSNMVTATLVATVASSILTNINSGLNVAAVVCIIGFLSAQAFATPPSMPHIAISIGSGYANTKDALLYGSILMIIMFVITAFVGYPLANLVL